MIPEDRAAHLWEKAAGTNHAVNSTRQAASWCTGASAHHVKCDGRPEQHHLCNALRKGIPAERNAKGHEIPQLTWHELPKNVRLSSGSICQASKQIIPLAESGTVKKGYTSPGVCKNMRTDTGTP